MISIFLPTYNCSAFVGPTIESILSQSYADFELVCVDDGSTDDTVARLNDYASHDGRIRVLTKPNEGSVPFSWRFVFPHLRGEFTLYMSHDDVVEKDYLLTMVAAQASAKADVVISSCVFFETDMEAPEEAYAGLNARNDMSGRAAVSGREAFRLMLNYDIPGFGLWRTSLIRAVGMPVESFNSDEAMQRVWARMAGVVAFSGARFGYRQSGGSIVKGLKPYHYASLLSQRRLLAEVPLMEMFTVAAVRRFFIHFVKSLVYLTRQYVALRSGYSVEQRAAVSRVLLRAWNPLVSFKWVKP